MPAGSTEATRAVEAQAAAAIEACRMGASVANLRARLFDGREPDVVSWGKLAGLIRASCDMLVQFGRITMPPALRRRLLELKPDMASFLLGHHDVITAAGPLHGLSTLEDQCEIAGYHLDYGVLPECLVSRPGNVWNMRQLIDRGLLQPPYYAMLPFGAPGGEWSPATPTELVQRVALLPPNTNWAVTVQGPEELAMNALAISQGGHLRISLADTPDRDLAAERNRQIMASVTRLATALGRDIASPSEARQMLGLPRRPRV
jgi:3-keto-5-aminohexanoate cleavage enzyme